LNGKKKQHKAFEDLKDEFAIEGVFKQEGHLIASESKKPCGTQL
jgi:hypothetical protein